MSLTKNFTKNLSFFKEKNPKLANLLEELSKEISFVSLEKADNTSVIDYEVRVGNSVAYNAVFLRGHPVVSTATKFT